METRLKAALMRRLSGVGSWKILEGQNSDVRIMNYDFPKEATGVMDLGPHKLHGIYEDGVLLENCHSNVGFKIVAMVEPANSQH